MQRVDPRTDMAGWLRQQYLEELRLIRDNVRRYPAHHNNGRLRAGEDVYKVVQNLIDHADEVKF